MELTTESSTARAKLDDAIDAFVDWRIDAVAHADAAIEADPGFTMAHAFKGLFLFGGRNDAYRPQIEHCLDRARAHVGAASAGEQHYVSALGALLDGRYDLACLHYESILALDPTDLLAHRLLQQELFWGGEARWMADVVERAAPAWSSDMPRYGAFQAVRAFSLEEAGDYALAERCGREAVEHDPGDCWGAHAVAHVLVMTNRVDDGRVWLDGLCENWSGKNQIVHHLWWHLCLFLLERGEHDRILELLDTQVRDPKSPLVQAVPDAYIDIQNVASLLLRLELRGVDVGDRWRTVADVARQRIGNFASPFTNAHAAAILASNAEMDAAEELVASMQSFADSATSSLAPRYRQAAIPAARGAIAHRRGDMQRTVELLMPTRRAMWQMGGSHAQRDIFTQLLVDAARRSGRHDYVTLLMSEMSRGGFTAPDERTLYADAVRH